MEYDHKRAQRRRRQAVLAHRFNAAMAFAVEVTVRMGERAATGKVTHCVVDKAAPPDQSPLVYTVAGLPVALRDVSLLTRAVAA